MATSSSLRDQGISAFSAGVLEFGTYDLAAQAPAGHPIAENYLLDAYAPASRLTALPRPLTSIRRACKPATNLHLQVIGADDILVEDNLAMATGLSAAGIELAIYPASPHGFTATHVDGTNRSETSSRYTGGAGHAEQVAELGGCVFAAA